MSEKENKGVTGSQTITFRVSGNEMTKKTGYNLDYVIEAFSNADNLIKKTYLALNDRERFMEHDAEKLTVRLTEIKEGSLLSELCVQYQSIIAPAMPFIISNQDFIMETIKDSYEFLKAKISAKKEGRAVDVVQKAGTNVVNINNNSGTVVITTPQGFPNVADKLNQPLTELAQSVDGKKITGIDIGTQKTTSSNIHLDVKDKDIFSGTTVTTDNEFQFSGKIISGNYETNRGRIEISSSENTDLEVGQAYSAEINPELHAEKTWKEMFLTDRPYYGKCTYQKNQEGTFKVQKLIITDWDESQWK